MLRQLCQQYSLNFNLNRSAFVYAISEQNIANDVLNTVRSVIFDATQKAGLAEGRATIMSRRGTSLNPLPRKLSEDIWDLADCLASGKHVKRTMYKGGKEIESISPRCGKIKE